MVAMESSPSLPTPAARDDSTACSAVTVNAYPLVIFGIIKTFIGAHNTRPVKAGNVKVCVGKAGAGAGAGGGCGGGGVVGVVAPPEDDENEDDDPVPPPVVDTNEDVWHCTTPNRVRARRPKVRGRLHRALPLDCMLTSYLT